MTKQLITTLALVSLLASCAPTRPASNGLATEYSDNDTPITQSLFDDKSATISEENIQKILAGTYALPQKLRVAVVRLENLPQQRRYYWTDEQYLKSQQAYLDLFTEKFRKSPRVATVAIIPDLLVSKSPSFTNLREAAVRMQADVVVVYSIASDVYSKYRLFASADIKAFATTQLLVLDVRTGLVPFSAISTKDAVSQKTKEELVNAEAAARVKNDAVLLTIADIGERITELLTKK